MSLATAVVSAPLALRLLPLGLAGAMECRRQRLLVRVPSWGVAHRYHHLLLRLGLLRRFGYLRYRPWLFFFFYWVHPRLRLRLWLCPHHGQRPLGLSSTKLLELLLPFAPRRLIVFRLPRRGCSHNSWRRPGAGDRHGSRAVFRMLKLRIWRRIAPRRLGGCGRGRSI